MPSVSAACPYTGAECGDKNELCARLESGLEENCVSRENSAIIVCKERGKSYKLINDQKLCVKKIKIDNCLMDQDVGRQCDFAILICACKICCFVELKGSDVDHACSQILNSINKLDKIISKCDKIHARIIPSRCPAPDVRSSLKDQLKRYCARRRGSLKIKARLLEESTGDL